jgi:hypothetical protein
MNTSLFLHGLYVSQVEPLGQGDHTRPLMMGEQKRTYLVHVPKSYDPDLGEAEWLRREAKD